MPPGKRYLSNKDGTLTVDYDLIKRTIDALVKTVNVLEGTVSALKDSVATQAKSLAVLTETIFGREDPVTLKHTPGVRDRVDSHERIGKWALIIGGAMIAVVTLHSLGLPTELVGKALSTLLGH